MTDSRAQTTCDQCDQTDDHPKAHFGLETYHHDCTPVKIKKTIIEGHNDPELATKVFDAAADGTHGDDLLALIFKLHEEKK